MCVCVVCVRSVCVCVWLCICVAVWLCVCVAVWSVCGCGCVDVVGAELGLSICGYDYSCMSAWLCGWRYLSMLNCLCLCL